MPIQADHPYTDPGDGRTECQPCGKWVWPVTHSCKGVPVTDAAKQRAGLRQPSDWTAEEFIAVFGLAPDRCPVCDSQDITPLSDSKTWACDSCSHEWRPSVPSGVDRA